MRVDDLDNEIHVAMSRDEFFLVQALMMEALETGDDRDFQTRVGATKEEVRALIDSLPDLRLGRGD